MSGYTPAFADMYMGTLYGRWPAAPVWATLIPLMDKRGHIDMSVQAIAGMTGWPIELLEQGIKQLMEPDPASRTSGHDGRRLVPIDPNRPWGWIAVNHGKYREKARLQAKDANRTITGADAERKRKQRDSCPTEKEDVPRSPPDSPSVPLSDTDTDTDTDSGSDARARDDESLPGDASKPEPTPAGAACLAMKAEGLMDVNPGHQGLLALLEEGAGIEELVEAAKTAVVKHKGFAYALAIVKGRRADAAQGKPTGLRGALPASEGVPRLRPDAMEVARARDAKERSGG